LTKADWYFDFISPFAYLQLSRFETFQEDLEINPVPVLFGGLLKHWGQLGPAEIPPKRKFVYRFFKWQADQNNIPFKMPPRHPYNPLAALRLCIAAGGQLDHIRSVFQVIYGEGTQPDEPGGIMAIAKALGIDDAEAAISDEKVKITLRVNTETAIKSGVFGVPTFLIDDQVFWGADATEMMLSYVNNPELFQTSEMRRISEMPMGVVRQK
jgi:2-hydroxychromene-2-carboxylate isomerase